MRYNVDMKREGTILRKGTVSIKDSVEKLIDRPLNLLDMEMDLNTLEKIFTEIRTTFPKRGMPHPWAEARKVFFTLVLNYGVDPKAILEGVKAYKLSEENGKKIGTNYIPMITTWLRQSRWENYSLEVESGRLTTVQSVMEIVNRIGKKKVSR